MIPHLRHILQSIPTHHHPSINSQQSSIHAILDPPTHPSFNQSHQYIIHQSIPTHHHPSIHLPSIHPSSIPIQQMIPHTSFNQSHQYIFHSIILNNHPSMQPLIPNSPIIQSIPSIHHQSIQPSSIPSNN